MYTRCYYRLVGITRDYYKFTRDYRGFIASTRTCTCFSSSLLSNYAEGAGSQNRNQTTSAGGSKAHGVWSGGTALLVILLGMHTGMWWNITTCELHSRRQIPCMLLCEATSKPLISCWCTSVWSPENNWYVNAVFQKSIYFRVRVRVRVRSHVSALGCTRVHLGYESKLGCRRMHLKVKVHEPKKNGVPIFPKNVTSQGTIC